MAVGAFLVGVIPTIGVLFLFWLVLRALLEADRRERSAQARIEAAERRAKASGGSGGPGAG